MPLKSFFIVAADEVFVLRRNLLGGQIVEGTLALRREGFLVGFDGRVALVAFAANVNGSRRHADGIDLALRSLGSAAAGSKSSLRRTERGSLSSVPPGSMNNALEASSLSNRARKHSPLCKSTP